MLSEICGVPVPRWRVPYAVGLAAAYISEFSSDHVSGLTPKATVTGVRLARRIMHFDASRQSGRNWGSRRVPSAKRSPMQCAGSIGRARLDYWHLADS